MAADRVDSSKTADAEKAPPDASSTSAAGSSSNTFKVWLPLVVNVVLMPVLAYTTTTFLLLPRLTKSDHRGPTSVENQAKSESSSGHGEVGTAAGKNKFATPISGKVLVNIAGTAGTRYLVANFTLVSPQPTVKEIVDRNDAELRDVAAGVLASKTIADLEKPGARNLIRSELISVFNNVLGDGVVTELYITEFAIQ